MTDRAVSRIAIVVEGAGAPGTLGSTAFVKGVADGLAAAGADVRVIGLARVHEQWHPETLPGVVVSAPWLDAPPPNRRDRMEAVSRGLFDGVGLAGPVSDDWRYELLLLRELSRFAAGDTAGVVILYSRSHWVLDRALSVTRRLGWRLLVSSNEALTDAQIDPSSRDSYIRCVVDETQGVLAVSSRLAGYWRDRGVHEGRIAVIPLYVREVSFAQAAMPGGHSAIYLGNLAHKEIDYLLDITELVTERVPAFHLTIYGDAPAGRRAELEGMVASRGLERVITVAPPVHSDGIAPVLVAADVLLLPRSLGEFSQSGFPNKLGEYLASGRPVVTTAVGDIPMYLEDGESALIVQPDDIRAFAEAVVKVLEDPSLGARIGASGREAARREFHAHLGGERLLRFAGGLAVPGPPRGPRGTQRLRRVYHRVVDVAELKRIIVRGLRALRLKAPAPGS